MEFMEGVGVTDVDAIKALGIQPSDVAKIISQAFAEMIFKHGFVHCDPHAANMMVRVAPSSKIGILGGFFLLYLTDSDCWFVSTLSFFSFLIILFSPMSKFHAVSKEYLDHNEVRSFITSVLIGLITILI